MSEIVIGTEKTDYRGGDVVNGHVVLSLHETIPVRGIRIRFYGFEYTSWTTGFDKNRRFYTDRRELFDYEQTLFGKPRLDIGDAIADAVKGIFSKDRYEIMAPGMYDYDFSFKLPLDLPGDFQSIGASRIAYELTASVDIPLKLDISSVKILTICENQDPEAIQPVSIEAKKRFLLDFLNPFVMSVSLERNMFFPGESVRGVLEVANHSDKTIEAITVTLKQTVELIAKNRTNTLYDSMKIHEIRSPRVPKGKKTRFDLAFNIPPDLYCTITSARLIRVRHELIFNLDVPWAIDLNIKAPITLIEKLGVPSGRAGDR